MKPKYFLFFFLIAYCIPLTATIRFVSKSGTSTPPYTSWQTAADSIQKCINICVSGDTIYVANGVYKENLVINTAISLIGSSMDSTIVDGTALGELTVVFNANGNIQNFSIYGKGATYLTSRVIRSNTLNTQLIITNCQLSNSGVGVSMVGGDVRAEYLIIHDATGGFNLFGEASNNISNCSIYLDTDDSFGINIGIGPNVRHYINNNIILFTGTVNQNPGNGISIGAPRSVYINNNLISGFTDNIFVDDPIDTVFIKNNLLRNQNAISPDPASIVANNDDLLVNNLIFSQNKNSINGDWRVRSDYNLFWENEINLQGVTKGDSDFVADPMFLNDTIPTANGNYDFHLQKYSPAIDKGNPDILDLDGTRSDIGMYGGPFGETYTYQDLAPLAPRNISAVVDTNQILLKWNHNTEADTAYYKVFRDTTINFTIDSTKLISLSSDTVFIQLPPYFGSKYVYKITCVDKQGNESKPSEEVAVDLTSVSTDGYPITINDYLLYQNYPNPFNPSTRIGYKLKERSYVKLYVYDIKGELVSVLVNKEQNSGYYEVEFNAQVGSPQSAVINSIASGIYLYRIEVIGEGNIPVYTEMKKMLLIK